MEAIDQTLRTMDFGFFGKGMHMVPPGALFDEPDAVFVDLRSDREVRVLPIRIDWLRVVHIPLHELPDRWGEIPGDAPVGLFCSGETRSAIALAYLQARGLRSVRIVAGGLGALVEELKPGKVFKRNAAGE